MCKSFPPYLTVAVGFPWYNLFKIMHVPSNSALSCLNYFVFAINVFSKQECPFPLLVKSPYFSYWTNSYLPVMVFI